MITIAILFLAGVMIGFLIGILYIKEFYGEKAEIYEHKIDRLEGEIERLEEELELWRTKPS